MSACTHCTTDNERHQIQTPELKSGQTLKESESKTRIWLLPLGVTVSTVCEVVDPWTSGGFLTVHVKVPLSFSVALIKEMEASPRAGVPCHRIRPPNWPSVGGYAREEKWRNWKEKKTSYIFIWKTEEWLNGLSKLKMIFEFAGRMCCEMWLCSVHISTCCVTLGD